MLFSMDGFIHAASRSVLALMLSFRFVLLLFFANLFFGNNLNASIHTGRFIKSVGQAKLATFLIGHDSSIR